MQERQVDIAIIGAGSAGLGAWHAARQHTDKLVLIESGAFGTTCARVGCMPSKLLISAADVAHQANDAEGFGIKVSGVSVDGRAVMERLKRERDRFVGSVMSSMSRIEDEDRILGAARFEDATTLVVGEHTRIKAKRIVIATGSRPSWPDFLNGAGDRLIINDDLFEWQDLPESVVVFGPGVIGLELGQALRHLGVRVRMFGVGGAIGPLGDPELKQVADRTFNDDFPLDPDATVKRVAREGDQVVVTFHCRDSDTEKSERFDYLLAATGRRPNVDRLDLHKTGLELNERGVPLFDRLTMQCRFDDGQAAPIFIAGDANQDLPLLHEASDEGRIAGDNAGRYPEIRAGRRRTPLAVVFTDPQMASAGMGYAELKRRDEHLSNVAIGEVSFEDQGRSTVMRQNRGKLRLYAEHGTGILLGAEMFGPRAEHLGHLLAWSIDQRLTVDRLLEMPFYHPVVEEGLRTALRDLNVSLRRGPAITERCLECGPGA
ncbi:MULTISPECIES: dihydrolipoyl dehydrogenase [Halomonas]|uniref:dihydrolipoyl dehydrogenase n=1 Tax=Halomonas TaxID=2745 RepID=UPI001C96AE1B|nr:MULTISPECIES: dihydrolipoyl dehydrogenase [Halomonas]MBY6209426.1 dihydrolipoyl dehydrogenase [Halomonas sp. DP3Y7-2]MBY6229581.1 dihydrolipoyl dehydrogenase [Halomonas sp. DP3Y7-1]MCA0917359.1 dihydrolipoyl dehydrogenase [Halomonas denitrificans]